MITLVVGTNRPGSNTRKIVHQVAEIYRELDHAVRILDLADLPPEIFHPEAYASKPTGFHRFSEAVLSADGLVIATPEYNGSVPGVLKYFIDMLKFPESFERRPVCFIGVAAGIWGALRPVEQLQMIFGYRNAFIYPDRVFVPRVHEQVTDGGLIHDAAMTARLKSQAAGFIEFVAAVKPLRTTAA